MNLKLSEQQFAPSKSLLRASTSSSSSNSSNRSNDNNHAISNVNIAVPILNSGSISAPAIAIIHHQDKVSLMGMGCVVNGNVIERVPDVISLMMTGPMRLLNDTLSNSLSSSVSSRPPKVRNASSSSKKDVSLKRNIVDLTEDD